MTMDDVILLLITSDSRFLDPRVYIVHHLSRNVFQFLPLAGETGGTHMVVKAHGKAVSATRVSPTVCWFMSGIVMKY